MVGQHRADSAGRVHQFARSDGHGFSIDFEALDRLIAEVTDREVSGELVEQARWHYARAAKLVEFDPHRAVWHCEEAERFTARADHLVRGER